MERKVVLIACDEGGNVLWVFAYPTFTVGELTRALEGALGRVQGMAVLSAVERHSLSNVTRALLAALGTGAKEGEDGKPADG
ncbi:MAG: hypothetical protein ACUVS5_11865 [Anaerolineae bacterium]